MTLDIELKEQLLLHFHEKLEQPGWNFDGSMLLYYRQDILADMRRTGGPNEKDREVLTDFHVVIDEFGRLHEGYVSCASRFIYANDVQIPAISKSSKIFASKWAEAWQSIAG